MREITTHRVSGLNERLKILVYDEPGQGNACHRYHITTVEYSPPPEIDPRKCEMMLRAVHDIRFQNGPIKEVGVNGISNEVLLAIVRDRLEGFQSGQFACIHNQIALDDVVSAMGALHARTVERLERDVEGTNVL